MKFSVIATGGTIASVQTETGLKPGLSGEDLLLACPELMGFDHDVEVLDLMAKDSSNIGPSDWLSMAQAVRERSAGADAVILLHGTDTLAWTAAALSYLLNGLETPVVITGSMAAPGPGSDASPNIFSAFEFGMQLAMYRRRGVTVAFSDVLLHGPRVTKADSRRKNAFISVDYPMLGEMKDKGTHKIAWLHGQTPQEIPARPWGDNPAFETNIALLPLFPGMKASFLDSVVDSAPRAVVLEAFGLGGVPFMGEGGENLLPAIGRGIEKGIPFILRTQSLFGGTDPTVYEVGRRALDLGALSARSLPREALMTKLMLSLPVAKDPADLDRLLALNLCDDVTL